MNNPKSNADSQSQAIKLTPLAEKANQTNYNWEPLVDFFINETTPESLREDLSELYYELAELITDPDLNLEGTHGINRNHLWQIRQLIMICKAMTEKVQTGPLLSIGNNNRMETEKTVNTPDEKDRKISLLLEVYSDTVDRKNSKISELTERIVYLESLFAEQDIDIRRKPLVEAALLV